MIQKSSFQPKQVGWVGVVGGVMLTLYPAVSLAQVTGDGTLGTRVNGSAIAPCTGTCIITNGATRGSNLFHSFRQFSLPNGDFAGFITTPAIQNVIVRVTGVGQPFISNINGTIATSNSANFFLLNPNGIVFGPGATLNIGGSFLATTANRMQFMDGTEFRTNDPAPLLTVSVPIGLQMGQTPGEIRMQRSVFSAGQTDRFSDFALVGGNMTLDNSVIQTPGRQITLSAVGENGSIGLGLNGDRLRTELAPETSRRDVTLTNRTVLSANAGNLIISAENLTVTERSELQSLTLGRGNAGNILIDVRDRLLFDRSVATSSVRSGATGNGGNIRVTAGSLSFTNTARLSASTSGIGNAGNISVEVRDLASFDDSYLSGVVNRTGVGNGGNVSVSAGTLSLTNGGQLVAETNGKGDAGNILINARDQVILNGFSPNEEFSSGVFNGVAPSGVGKGGAIDIVTNSLSLTNGALLFSVVGGTGNAGNIRIVARDLVSLDGASPNGTISAITSSVAPTGIGNGSDINISASSLFLSNEAGLISNTAGQGNAGNILVNAREQISLDNALIDSSVTPTGNGQGGEIRLFTGSLILTNGAYLNSKIAGQGKAGNIQVQATNLEVIGGSQFLTITTGSASAGNIVLKVQERVTLTGANSGLFASTTARSTGNGGSITIDPRTVLIQDGAAIAVGSQGKGTGGNITIQADGLELRDRGSITAETASAQGGNITLDVKDLMLLRRNSLISATAGTAQAGGDGGNITIRTPFIIGVLGENSDITANAFSGRGGNITITTNAIFGLQFQPKLTPFSDITASSQFGLSGTVAINMLNIDPNRGLATLPIKLSDSSKQIGQQCSRRTRDNKFVVLGSGGVPLGPEDALGGSEALVELVELGQRGVQGAEFRSPEMGSLGVRGDSPIHRSAERALTKRSPNVSRRSPSIQLPIVEAQGLIVGTDGGGELVANAPSTNPVNVWITPVPCQAFQGK
ncbi:S-layer family protein (plasmid) [Phormidium sp. CLA17]|uniref:two-partner secretion domain-containing protein n=1 Tax=Leptolyngbya sp. Cla-17 TaxID=2803751 RepID=UPI00149257EA|nr:S-layer family protein [Leptolyngbya sp. Cla-17]MBM0745384.1 S-layer family protein [Leptolyngbya sp. Cla-17]